eukprot:728208-Rhodomonas_salina.2
MEEEVSASPFFRDDGSHLIFSYREACPLRAVRPLGTCGNTPATLLAPRTRRHQVHSRAIAVQLVPGMRMCAFDLPLSHSALSRPLALLQRSCLILNVIAPPAEW